MLQCMRRKKQTRAISPPNWCKQAVPTERGWMDPNTGEILVSGKISQHLIDEWYGVPAEPSMPTGWQPAPEVLNEAPANDTALEDMTKTELEALGRQHGIELDRREKKSALIDQLHGHMKFA